MKAGWLGGAIVFSLMVGVAPSVLACWGARPLSMGGGFIAVSDDVHSIYWNPAGLATVRTVEVTYSRGLNARDDYNYDDFWGVAVPLGFGTGGIGYTVSNYNFFRVKEEFGMLGYGISLGNTLSVGLSLCNQKETADWTEVEDGVSSSYSASGCVYSFSFGILWTFLPRWTFGLLAQDFNEPKLWGEKVIFNLRPGMAWRPTERLILAVNLYDMLDKTEGAYYGDVEIGAEALVTDHFALRLGRYHGSPTIGLGWKRKGWKVDYGFLEQHMVAIGYKF